MKIYNLILVTFFLGLGILSCKKEDPIPPGTATTSELIEEDITSDRVLTNRVADSTIADYCITDFIAIKNGAVVTIQPGVTIEFTSDAGIEVGTYTSQGVLVADGTFSQKITFRGKTKTAGFWRGIAISPTNTDVRNLIDNCIIEHTGSSILKSTSAGFGYKSAIGVGASSGGNVGLINIKNSIIRNNAGKGYSCKDGAGVRDFINNKFENNAEEAIFMNAEGFGKIDFLTTFAGNGYDGMYQGDFYSSIETIDEVGTLDWKNKNGSYFLTRGIRINNNSTTVQFNQGIEVVVGVGKMIHVDEGSFISTGYPPANLVTIKGTSGTSPSWRGILVESNSSSNLISYTNIQGGGTQNLLTYGCNGKANVGVYYWAGSAGKITVRNSNISNSGGCGIYVETNSITQRGELIQSGNTFTGNVGANVCN